MEVKVHGDNIDRALRSLKKKLQRESVFRDMRRKEAYEKPSEKRKRRKAEAERRARKAARRRAQQDGLL